MLSFLNFLVLTIKHLISLPIIEVSSLNMALYGSIFLSDNFLCSFIWDGAAVTLYKHTHAQH